MKGGARTNSGPPPDPNSRRQQTKAQASGWLDLPAAGFDGAVPEWPLSKHVRPDPDDDTWAECVAEQERAHWEAAWRTPQAHAWKILGWTHDVALYVRFMAMAELGDMKAATEVRQWSDRLGLNPAAMLRNRWRIKADDLADKRTEKSAPAKRRRLVVADAVEA